MHFIEEAERFTVDAPKTLLRVLKACTAMAQDPWVVKTSECLWEETPHNTTAKKSKTWRWLSHSPLLRKRELVSSGWVDEGLKKVGGQFPTLVRSPPEHVTVHFLSLNELHQIRLTIYVSFVHNTERNWNCIANQSGKSRSETPNRCNTYCASNPVLK